MTLACLAIAPLTQAPSPRYTVFMPITEQEYRERKHKLLKERADLVQRLETIDKRLESLEVVWSWFKEDQEQPLVLESRQPEEQPKSTLLREPAPMPNGVSEKFSLLDEVNEATREIEGEITQPAITKLLQERFPNENVQGASVSNRLSRLSQLGELEVVRKGVGSQPTIYRRAN